MTDNNKTKHVNVAIHIAVPQENESHFDKAVEQAIERISRKRGRV